MNGVRQVFAVAGYNFRRWHKNPRICMVFALAFILCFLLSDKVVRFAEEHQTGMELLEPFIWTFGDADSILLAALLLVFLFADMPFLTNAVPFYLMRTTRRIWLLGQAVYIIAGTALYLLFVMAATSVVCMQRSFAANFWSGTAALLGYSGAGESIGIPAVRKTMEMVTPWKCAAIILLLMLLYSLLQMFVMLVCNLWKGQLGGMIGVFAFSLYGFLLSPDTIKLVLQLEDWEAYRANVIVGWLSPLNHATFQMHNFGYDLLPSLQQTCLVFGALIILLFLAAGKMIRTYSFTFTGTQGG